MKFSDIYKKGYGVPADTDIIEGGLCIDVSDDKAYSKNESGEVFQIGLNEEDVTDIIVDFVGMTPIGGIIMFSGQLSTLNPLVWAVCNGSGVTPNLVNKFVYGTNIQNEITPPATGGFADSINVSHNHSTIAHNHTGTTDDGGRHRHQYTRVGAQATSGAGYENSYMADWTNWTTYAEDHTHAFTTGDRAPNTYYSGADGTGRNLPPYVKLAYIMRIS